MKEILTGLLLWIVQNTALVYDANDGLPQVEQVEPRELAVLIFKGEIPAYVSQVDLNRAAEHLEATYRPDTRTIYVRRGIDLASVHGRGVLVHELVHFIQYQQGMHRKVVCANALEEAAYRAQAAYLRQGGVEPVFDGMTIVGRSMC
jgi:hypothetical protein